MIELVPIWRTIEENQEFANNPDCRETLAMSIEYHRLIGFEPPWIGYFARMNGEYTGSGGFKGAPFKGRVEIAYGTFERFRSQGIGTEICGKLVELSLLADPSILITARTLPEKNHSTRILEKNGFQFAGVVQDIDDGEVWEWLSTGINHPNSNSS